MAEFKIQTKVELDTSTAESKLKSFVNGNNNKKIPITVDLKLKNINKALNSDLHELNKKINQRLQISADNLQGFQKLNNILLNIKNNLKGMDDILSKGKINIFNTDGLNPKILDENTKALENYAKKAEQYYKKIRDAKDEVDGKNSRSQTIKPHKPVEVEVEVDVDKANKQIDKFENKIDQLRFRFNKLDVGVIGTDNIQSLNAQLDRTFAKAKQSALNGDGVNTPEVDRDMKVLREKLKLLQKIETQYNNFKAIKLDLGDLIDPSSADKIENVFKDTFRRIATMDDFNLDFNFDGLLDSVKRVNSQLKETKSGFSSVRKIASDFKNEIASYTIGEVLGEATIDFARSIGQSYMELDRSMREIKKVADPSDIDTPQKLNEIRKQAIGIAKDVGMASSEVQSSIASALQAGMGGMKESIEVAKQSMVLANVGDMSQDSASKAINTVVKSFNLSPLKSYQVEVNGATKKTTKLKNAMDLMNYAGNNYAIGTDGIAEAMKRGGAVLASYNVSLEDSVGLITATNEAIQDPARVGNGLKTIAVNLAGMKASVKDGSIGMNKTAMALKEIAGVDVFKDKDKGELKNMVEVLDEVRGKWDTLSDAQQKALSESIAGKQQATVFQSLMQNYKAFDKIRNEFASGQHFGSAEKENEQYVNSLDGKLNKLKETWTSTFTTLVNSNLAYGALDGLIAISEAINKIVTSLSEMNALFPVMGMLFSGVKSFISKNNPITKQTTKLDEMIDAFYLANGKNREEVESSKNIDKETNNATKKIGKVKTAYDAFKKSVANGEGITGGFKAISTSLKDVEKGTDGVTSKSKGLKDVFSGLGSSLKDIGKGMLAGGIVSLVTTGVGMGIQAINNKMHELSNTKKELYGKVDGLKQENNGLKENSYWLQSNKDRYNELIENKKKYDNLPSLSKSQESEMKELKNLQSQIAEMNPDLVLGYNSDGSPILAMAGDMDKLIQKTEKAIEKNNELINGNKREIGKTASEEIRYGEYGGTSLMRQLKNETEAYQLALKQQNKYFNDKNSSALESIGAFNGKKYAKALRERETETQKHYDKLLETTQSYLEKEREVQDAAFTRIEEKKNFKNLGDTAKAEITQIADMVNWGKFNNKDQRVWINGIDKMSQNFGKNKGAIQAYREEWEKLNEEYALSGDYEKYSKSMDKIAKGMAEIMGVDTSNVGSIKKGLMQVVEPLEPAEKELNDFLKSYNKTLADVEAGDSLAIKLADQFNAINNAMEIFADEGSYKKNGALTFEAVVEISQLENLPSKIKQFADKAKADGITKLESEMIITQVEIARSGGFANNGSKDLLTEMLENGKATGDIQINPDFTLTQERIAGIIEWNKNNPNNKITAEDLFDLDGIAKASRQITDNIFKDMYKGNKDGKLKIAIEGLGLDTEGKANNLKKALDSIPEEKRVEFVENFGDAFSKTEDFKEAIQSLPKEVRLNYGIGIEGDKELSALKTTLDNLKRKGKVPIDFEVNANNIDKLMMFQALLDNFEDSKVYEIPFDIVMKSGSVQDLVNELKSKFNLTDQQIEAKFGIKVDGVEKAQSDLNTLQETANNLEKNGATVKINGEQVNASLEDVKAWAELSKEVSEGNYQMKMDLQVEDAIKNATDLESRLSKINGKEYKASFMVKTAEAYNKLKALITKIQQVQKLSSQKMTSTVSVNTAQARKNMTGLINKIHNLRDAMSKLKSININVNTAQARKNISGLLIRINQIQEKSGNKSILFTAKTQTARKNISGLIKRASQYKGKTYHASFIAHTSKAYSKIGALISRCKAYGGKTYHASFIAHTKQAYEKIGALLSRARSYDGNTYHASMTVTTNKVEKIISKPSGKPEAPANLTRTVTTTYADDGIMPIDEPMSIDETTTQSRGRTREGLSSKRESIKFNEYASYLDKLSGGANAIKEAFMLMHQMVDKAIKDTVGKTTKLADMVKQGTTVVLTSITNSVKDILDALKFDINRLQELDNTIARISHSIDVLDKKLDNSVGSQRIAFLQRQNLELKKRIKLNEELLKQKKREKEVYKQELKKKGIKFTKDDNISNYEEMMLKLKREMEKLDQTSEKASEKETKRNEKRKKEIEELIKLMEAFNKLVYGDIFDIESSIIEDSNQVENNELEIKQIEYEKWVVRLESAFKNVNKELQKLTNQLEMLDVQMEHAWGKEKLDLMNKQIDLIKKSQSALKNNLTVMESAKDSAKNKLIEYGFKFNQNGDIENFVEQMNHLKDTSKEFDTIQGLVDGYFDLYLEQIPEAERELAEFNNKIKDIYKEQLNATKELEDKIIDMYKKQLEERKKLIDEELKKRLDALKKEQDAYKRAREEQNYKDDFNEQADKVKEIQKQIDLARKDTSLTGQKKLKDLLKQLEEEKKKLDEITQDRIDQQVDNAFKDEEDRLEQGAEDEKDRLDEMFSDEELLKKAQEAIKNGLFIGIDGEVKNLQSALLEYIDKWEEGLSATGAIIKSEWITNLEIANSLIKDYAGILDNIGVGSLNTNEIYNKIPNIKIDAESKGSDTKSINYNQPLVVVQGNVDSNNIEQIKRVVQESIDRNNREILRKI